MDSSLSRDYVWSTLSKGQKTRLHILEKSVESCVRLGFEGASITEITRIGRVNRGSINHYFGNKEALIRECLDYVGVSGRCFTDDFMATRTDIVHPIERYLRATFGWQQAKPYHASFLWQSIQKAAYDSHTKKTINMIFDNGKKRVATLLDSVGRFEEREALAERVHTTIVGFVFFGALTVGRDEVLSLEEQCWRSVQGILLIPSA
jgi:AcrR family transcriptional regulator